MKVAKIFLISAIFTLAFFSLNINNALASSCQRIGNTTYCSDGTSYQQIGNTIYGSDGTSYQGIGNTIYGSDGTTYQNIGNTTYTNYGTSYQNIGNTTYGSDGSSYQTIGNTTYGSGNTYSTCPANSTANSSGKCSCNYGYSVNASKTACVYTGTYTAPSTPTCPANSYYDGVSSCKCNYGYSVNSTKTACVLTPPTPPTSISSTESAGSSSSCLSYGTGGTLRGSLCYCATGYQWNSAINSCVVGYPTFTRSLDIGSTGTEVVNLKNLLAVEGWYTGYVSTSFDQATASALKLYQAIHGISATGTVGPLTRAALNKSVVNGY